jgi:trehalose synthase
MLRTATGMESIPITTVPLARFHRVIGSRQAQRLRAVVRGARSALGERTIWHVNSTRTGGGVAEMLQTLLGYERSTGVDSRWLVIEGDAPFFTLTKRIHHHLHGGNGDGLGLGDDDHRHYRRIMRQNVAPLLSHVRSGDVVVLHDPQTAGLALPLRERGAIVIWRCHVGRDRPNRSVTEAWDFLRPYLEHAHGFIFSRECYVPASLGLAPVAIIPPAIDAFSAKNRPLPQRAVRSILRQIGVLASKGHEQAPRYRGANGSWHSVTRAAEILQTAPLTSGRTPVVLQVSRWDPLKDMEGVMRSFAEGLDRLGNAHLVLAGPDVRGVSDDPEGAQVLERCVARWHHLPQSSRERVHLVSLPMDDLEENAVMVNALQRHASVVVQKSLHEGFGLTVTEAMWKRRPIVASAVGGIQDQIVDGIHGILLDDPADRRGLAAALAKTLADSQLARRLGRNAYRRAVTNFLGPTQFRRTLELIRTLLEQENARRAA